MPKRELSSYQRQTLMISLLSEKEYLCEELQKKLSCTRATIYNILKTLKAKGYDIKTKKLGKKSLFYLQAYNFEPLTADYIRKYIIINRLQKSPIPDKKLKKNFTIYAQSESQNMSVFDLLKNKTFIDCKQTKFYELLNELIANNEIAKTPNNYYYATGKNCAINMELSADEAYDLYYDLTSLNPGTAGYEALQQLLNSLKSYNDFFDGFDFQHYEDNYIVYGNIPKQLKDVSNFINKLPPEYKSYRLMLKFLNRHKKEIKFTLALGLIVYNIEKDKIYLIGETDNSKDTIVNADTIQEINATNIPCSTFFSEKYTKLFEEMISISIKEPIHISVDVAIIGNTLNKFRVIHSQRPTSLLTIHDTFFTYEDNIRGLSDFMPFLRSLGRSLLRASPSLLAEKLTNSVEHTLFRYQETMNYDI